MLRIFQRLWQKNWAEQWQYRANLLMYLLYGLVSPVVYLAVWTTIANAQGSVGGLTANDFVTYYLTLVVVGQFTSDITIYVLAYKIKDGTLSSELLRPIHPVLTQVLVNNIAQKALSMIGLVPVFVALLLIFRPDYSMVNLRSTVLALLATGLGFAINFLLGAIITCLAFWTTQVYAISEFSFAFGLLFSGQFVPLQLMPAAIQSLASFLPFQMFLYIPVELFLNRIPPELIARHFGVGLVWLAILFIIFTITWREGVKRFSAVGA